MAGRPKKNYKQEEENDAIYAFQRWFERAQTEVQLTPEDRFFKGIYQAIMGVYYVGASNGYSQGYQAALRENGYESSR